MQALSQKQDEIINALNRHNSDLITIGARAMADRALLFSIIASHPAPSLLIEHFQRYLEGCKQLFVDKAFDNAHASEQITTSLEALDKEKRFWLSVIEEVEAKHRRENL